MERGLISGIGGINLRSFCVLFFQFQANYIFVKNNPHASR